MEFRRLSNVPDGGSSALERGKDILCHLEMTYDTLPGFAGIYFTEEVVEKVA
jgi:hypothetical protein